MYDHIQAAIQPVLVDYAVWLILGAFAWLMRRLPERFRLDIEARHREALHRALDTAAGLVLDTAQMHPAIAIPDAAITRGLGYVQASVPRALRKLGPSPEMLSDMMRAKLQDRLDAITGRDRLAEALRQAGAR